jgi:L-seryl-tRNA(Ser) seleniumtransferase
MTRSSPPPPAGSEPGPQLRTGPAPDGDDHGVRVARLLRALPAVDRVLDAAGDLVSEAGRQPVVTAVREVLEGYRDDLRAGARTESPQLEEIVAAVAARARPEPDRAPRRVVNATGVVIHTNLGRAPLSAAATAAVTEAAGYCDLEYDLPTGARGSRGTALEPLLAEVCGAEAATAVNNAASALVLVLSALARGRDVLVSRGELIEIGGSFRLPDILAASGARLVEVGTTNRTRASDYGAGEDVALILRMHPSNYRIVGFTEAPSLQQLAEVAATREVPLVYDVGSGLVEDRTEAWARSEPSLRSAIAGGADLVIASGDKLLGGPQAGLIAGRADLVAACRRHPLARALRLDKLRVAALVATLEAHLRGRAEAELPVWRMLTAPAPQLWSRTRALADSLPGAQVVDGQAVVGGGSAPGAGLEGPVLRLPVDRPDAVAAALRTGDPPIVVRVEDGAVVSDLRTVDAVDDALLAARLRAVDVEA